MIPFGTWICIYIYICIPLLDRNVGLEQRTILKCFQALLILKLGKMPKWWFRVNSECHGQYWNHHHLVDKPSPPGRTRTMQWPRLQMPWMPPVQGLRIFPKNHVMILGSRVGVWKGRRSVTTDDWRPITLICWKKQGYQAFQSDLYNTATSITFLQQFYKLWMFIAMSDWGCMAQVITSECLD